MDEFISKKGFAASIKKHCSNCAEKDGSCGGCAVSIMLKLIDAIPAADVVPGKDFRDCRNELCIKCGNYREAHKGACDGCRWRKR